MSGKMSFAAVLTARCWYVSAFSQSEGGRSKCRHSFSEPLSTARIKTVLVNRIPTAWCSATSRFSFSKHSGSSNYVVFPQLGSTASCPGVRCGGQPA